MREGQFGRIFRLAVSGGQGEVKAVYAGAKVLESTKDGKGDDYEGLLCVAGAGGKILVVQGERGGSKPYPNSVLALGLARPRGRHPQPSRPKASKASR